jgi:hypothetical protein
MIALIDAQSVPDRRTDFVLGYRAFASFVENSHGKIEIQK